MAEIALLKTMAEQQLATQWLESGHLRPGLGALRTTAFDRFQNSGLPNRRGHNGYLENAYGFRCA